MISKINKQKILNIYFFLLIASMFFLKYDDSRTVYLKIILALYGFIYLFTRMKNSIKIPGYFWTLFLYIFIGFFSSYIKGNFHDSSIFYIVRFIQWLIISIIIYDIFINLKNPKETFYLSWVILLGISDLLLIVSLLSTGTNLYEFITGDALRNRYMGVFFTNSSAAIYSAISAYFAYVLLKSKNKKIFKVILILILSINILSIIIQGTRSGLIFLFLVFSIDFFSFKMTNKKLLIMLLVIVVFLPLLFYAFFESNIIIFERFRNLINFKEESSFIRFELMKIGLKLYYNNPIIGLGPDNFRNFVHLYNPDFLGYTSHSFYLSSLTNFGIIGFLIILYFILKTYFKSLFIKDRSINVVWLTLMIMLLISGGFFMQPYSWFIISFIWVESRNKKIRMRG